jgi:hypothetical protein
MHALLSALVLLMAYGGSWRFQRIDRVLAEVPAGGDTLRVVAGIIRDRFTTSWPDSSVESIRIVNRQEAYQYSDTFFVHKGPEGPLYAQVVVGAWPVKWSRGYGLKLRDEAVHPELGADYVDEHCRYFALRGERLVPVTPWCSLCGDMLSGDRVMHSVGFGWCYVLVPLRIRFDLARGGLEVVPVRSAGSGGLAELEVGGVEAWVDTASRAFLYRRVTGEAGDSVSVTPDSEVKVVRVYAECAGWGDLGNYCPDDIRIDVRRLEVIVDGKHGFVEERDFPALGLYEREEIGDDSPDVR